MSTNLSTSFTASGTFSLTDESGVTIFTFSPSFTTVTNTTSKAMYAGEQLAETSSGSELVLGTGTTLNVDRIFTFIKNVDTDYAVEVDPTTGATTSKEVADLKPGECFFSPMDLNADGSGTTLKVISAETGATAQKVQYLLCDALDN